MAVRYRNLDRMACVLAELVHAASDALGDYGLATDEVITAGEVPFDFACPFVYGSIRTVYPSALFPAMDVIQRKCAVMPDAASAVVGLLVCSSTFDDQGNPPSLAVQSAEAVEFYTASSVLRAAVVDYLSAAMYDWSLGAWVTIGPSGGVIAGEQQLVLGEE